MSDFKQINNFWFWCQKVLPLVYDDSISYYEVLCKMSDYLNQVINNVNALPDLIDDKIKEYISSGEIQNVLNEILQNYFPIDVKNPPADLAPAVGDGTTDDTVALQNIINYAADHNLPMIFPAGVYRVSTLTIAEEAHFLGVGNPTIFKLNNTEDALINVEGSFTAFGMSFNANIAGVITPVDAIAGTCDNISLSKCSVTGCISGVDAFVSGIMQIEGCKFSNYTDYAVHAKGNGRLFVDGMEVESVANSGAMRFVRIDTSNSIVDNLTSLASVPIGIEITGDFNEVTARMPNCENPVNDGGQNNNYNIIGQSVQKKVTGKMTYAANESEENMGSKKVINAEDVVLNPTNPLTYKTPTNTTENKPNYIEFKDNANNIYCIPTMLADLIPKLGYESYKTITDFGAYGDGRHDDTSAFISALSSNSVVFIPEGTYNLSDITAPASYNAIFIIAGNVTFNNKNSLNLPSDYGMAILTNATNSNPYKEYSRGVYSGTGGSAGYVLASKVVDSWVTGNINNYVWSMLSRVEIDTGATNSAQHSAFYSQAIGKTSDTGLWSACFETNTEKANPIYSKLGVEISYTCSESDDNNMRVLLHLAQGVNSGATGSQVFAMILMGGQYDGSGTETNAKYGIALDDQYFSRFIGIRPGAKCSADIFIDLEGIDCETYGIRLSSNVLAFINTKISESGGVLSIDGATGINLNASTVNVAGNTVSKGQGSGAPTGSPTGYIPVSIDGANFKIPLYPA